MRSYHAVDCLVAIVMVKKLVRKSVVGNPQISQKVAGLFFIGQVS